MKRLAHSLLIVIAACVVSCTSDDNTNDSPAAAGDNHGTPSGKEQLWRVESIMTKGDSTFYSYDADGRLTRFVRHMPQQGNIYDADTVLYAYDMANGRIFTTYRCHHYTQRLGYGEYRVTTDTLFLKAGIVDSCAGMMRHSWRPDADCFKEVPFTIKFTYDAEGRLLHHVIKQPVAFDFNYSYVWDGDNIVETLNEEAYPSVTTAFSYGAEPDYVPTGFPLNNNTLLLPQHEWLFGYGYFGRQNRNLTKTAVARGNLVYGYQYSVDADGRISSVRISCDTSCGTEEIEYKVTWTAIPKP